MDPQNMKKMLIVMVIGILCNIIGLWCVVEYVAPYPELHEYSLCWALPWGIINSVMVWWLSCEGKWKP
jgi:hypothetical protein